MRSLGGQKDIIKLMIEGISLIQAGMGVNVSNKRLANESAKAGERLGKKVMGVVSGTGIAIVTSRRLQRGDPDGSIREALASFPIHEMAERVLAEWFVEGGIPENQSFRESPMVNMKPGQKLLELLICANYAEVKMAQEGHKNPIGVNYLEKIQTPRLPELLGAIFAGVDFVLMGAGIPNQVPQVLDRLANLERAEYFIDVEGAEPKEFSVSLDPLSLIPQRYVESIRERLKRPKFLAIISSNTLARFLTDERRTPGYVDGFIIEGPTAGGHNASPRGKFPLNRRGEPVYGTRDVVDLDEMNKLGRPYWLAGSYGHPDKILEAMAKGAQGVQVGTAFALSSDSGFEEGIRRKLIEAAYNGELDIMTDARSSPTGFPFKVALLPGTLSDESSYSDRKRVCNIGYLRQAYKDSRGIPAFRCPSEPIDTYLAKGGKLEDTEGRKCLCNALMAAVDVAQTYKGKKELPIITLGDDYSIVRKLTGNPKGSFSAADVVSYLLNS